MDERGSVRGVSWPAPLPLVAAALLLATIAIGLRGVAGRPGDGGYRAMPGQAAIATPIRAGATPARATPPPTPTQALPGGPVSGRVGLQIGHWRSEELPDELAVLRSQTGGSSGGYREVDINYAVAERVAALLTERGVAVDLLPATVPPGYQADAFIAIHCDINNDSARRGYKLARFGDSAVPSRDDALVTAVAAAYGAATGQPVDPELTRAMIYYYAFNGAHYRHAIAPSTPATIVELGFLTNPADRLLLATDTDTVAHGLADGILRFLLAAR